MGRMSDNKPQSTLAKLLLIGDGKLGKTYYAALAAKAGFNVLYLDGDVGAPTIGSMIQSGVLSAEDASRIYLLDIRDTIMGGVRDTKMVEFMNEFSSSITLKWNETENRLARRNDVGEIWEIKPGRMGPNDLIVMDSWTGYAESVMLWCGRANSVDIGTAKTHEMRPVYQGGGLKSTEMLQVIRSLPCNLIVIAHPDEYQHTTLKDGTNKGQATEKDQIVDWTKMIPKTVSKPQGLQMSKYFTDVCWMELSPDGKERRLNFKPKNDKVCGGHFSESKSIEEYSFANLVKAIGGPGPDGADATSWLTISHIEAPTQVEQPVLDGTKSAAISGLAGFMQKK